MSTATLERPAATETFTWSCWKHEDKTEGTDRAEYAAHMKTHGLKAPTAPKKIKLRKQGPAYRPAPLEVQPFKWARWTETHTTPSMCGCGHYSDAHHVWYGNDGHSFKCAACDCTDSKAGPDTRSAERRGQFWANGSAPHSVWVIPFEPLPWEATTRPGAPVLLYVGKPGRFFTDAYSAKYDRR